MLHNILFKVGYSIKDRDFLNYYTFFKKNEYKPISFFQEYQEEKLQQLIDYSYNNVPYYHDLIDDLDLKPEQIKTIDDLEKLPILTKDIIRSNYDRFIPLDLDSRRWVKGATGGSTGEPFRYRMSVSDESMGLASMYADFGSAGYELGDKIAIIAGSSLISNTGSKLSSNCKGFVLNELRISSFDLSDAYLEKMIRKLNRFKPKYIRGYASSVYLLSNFIRERKVKLDFKPKGIFTTAEVLFSHQRAIIEEVFSCKVFDHYGLNDGGVSAVECENHCGMHINMLRSIMEVVDENGSKVKPGVEGHILATSLHNYAFPFIRYDTKDLAVLSPKICACKRNTPLISKIVGRAGDFIYTPEGNAIHGEFFAHIFWEIGWAKRFQIISKRPKRLVVRIAPISSNAVNDTDLNRIRDTISKRTGSMDIEFEIVDEIETTSSGKWRFIINEV